MLCLVEIGVRTQFYDKNKKNRINQNEQVEMQRYELKFLV